MGEIRALFDRIYTLSRINSFANNINELITLRWRGITLRRNTLLLIVSKSVFNRVEIKVI